MSYNNSNEGKGRVFITKSIYEGEGNIKRCIRRNPHDLWNGWCFYSDTDTLQYSADMKNFLVVDWEALAEVEPEIESILNLPIGTHLLLETDKNGERHFRKIKTPDDNLKGTSVVSRNLYEGKGKLYLCQRHDPLNHTDNGWRFLSDIDTKEYCRDPRNFVVVAWETVVAIEPEVEKIFDLPIGSDLALDFDEFDEKHFFDVETEELVI